MKNKIVRQVALFDRLPDHEIDSLIEASPETSIAPGEILFEEGAQSDHFFIIMDGEVEIVKALGTTDERILALNSAGSLMGEMSKFSTHRVHTAAARARTPVRLIEISFDAFDALLHRHPKMAYDLLRLYSRRLEESESLTIQDLREKNRQLTLAYQELQAAQAAMIEKEKLEHELEMAAQIQRAILPEEQPAFPGLDIGAMMVPARLVGGDFYDFIPLDDQRMGIVVGDVCDKGMPAALFMALTYSSLRAEAFRHSTAGDTLRAVNQHLLQVNRSDMFVTLLYGILDLNTRQFTYARAGHPEPLVLDRDNAAINIQNRSTSPIGLFEDFPLDEQSVLVPPGGTLLIYSDGLSETLDETPDSPGLAALCAGILDSKPGAQDFCDQLWRAAGGPSEVSLIQDDFTVVALKNLDRP